MCGFVYFKGKEKDVVKSALEKLHHRGPDSTRISQIGESLIGFKRLAIMDLSEEGNQPFESERHAMACNGEIYNHRSLKEKYSFEYKSESDCEVILPIIERGGIEGLVYELDGEYALVYIDKLTEEIFAARDPMGIRPLFYGYTKEGKIAFASEAKALLEECRDIAPFPPGHYYNNGDFISYLDLSHVDVHSKDTLEEVCGNIRTKLEKAVIKRMDSDAPIGFLLSGGLDSSLVCAIAQKHSKTPIKTFAIGMSEDAIDLKYAKEVADHIGSDHTEVIITKDDVLKALRDVIYHLETWDITTTRASVGMYLVCKHIKEKTDIKVLMTGEVSDEIFGYKYTDFAPSAEEFQKEAAKRVKELYIYDVLRADRCISANSLEARVPFSDADFVSYVMSVDPKLKMNSYGHGKYLLRKAFEGDYLPLSILFREKAAFSDAVGHSLVDYIKEYAEELYSEVEFKKGMLKYDYGTPFTKESLMFRDIFEGFYPGKAKWIKDFWMPNKEWENCDVADPSARVLPNYGASGA
ncbi:MAG: asparagine synthetase B [Halobacteriovoraceae bacterium]|nr:asparagine synthetase B [Halobacteriovoraceae bacterium]|tara:strand:- start:52089 stop:53657 length:1569 start_codon:yes stop_codon:yes gene_type:complete